MKKLRVNQQRLDLIRRGLTPQQNHVVDEFSASHISRRDFLRFGSVFGIALPTISAALGAFGLAESPEALAAGKPGGVIRIALTTPPAAIDPVLSADGSSATLLQQTGEYLVNDNPQLVLEPALAESWSPNTDGSAWTFKIRRGVKFHDGSSMTADDVVATFDRLTDPKNSSNALTAFAGTLSNGNIKKIDDYTVVFHLDGPNGNFPYYVSSDNYNAIILPRSYSGNYEKTFIGTGPFKLEKFTPKVSASFIRHPDYWGKKALVDRTTFSFYSDFQSQMLAMQGRQVDIVAQVPVQGGQALIHNPAVRLIAVKSSWNNQVHMRCDTGPFKDKRVRQALALSLNREGIIKGLLGGMADMGNDHPFAPIFPSSDHGVPQRKQDLAKARQLMAAAGVANGFSTTLTTEQYIEIPAYAQVIQDFARQIGIAINLKVESQDSYYGKAVFGQSDWLDSPLGITDYSHRGVPNLLLSELTTTGGWNAAHFKSPEYDQLVAQYVAALDLSAQRAVAGKVERLLQDETPVIYGYFSNFITATTPNLSGVVPTANNQLFLNGASFS